MAKIEWDDRKTVEWMGVAVAAGNTIIRGANFALQQMLTRTASRLDIADSAIRIEFRRMEHNVYRWVAVATFHDRSPSYDVMGAAMDPMHALAELVEKVEQNDG